MDYVEFCQRLGRESACHLNTVHQYLKWNEVKVNQSCLTLCDPMVYTVYGILQARILEWLAFPFSRESFQLEWLVVLKVIWPGWRGWGLPWRLRGKEFALQCNGPVGSLIQQDPTCCRTTKPVHHNYQACAPQLPSLCSRARGCSYASLCAQEPPLHGERRHRSAKPRAASRERPS